MRGINFYWRIVGMNRLSERTQLTDCIEEKLRNFLGYSMRSSYPEIEYLYNAAYESAERQCRMELELGPRNPSAIHKKRSQLNPQEGREMNKYMARLTAAQRKGYGNTYNSWGIDPTLPPPGAKRPMKGPKEPRSNDNGEPPPAFSLLYGGRRRTRRRRTTKKRTRKQRRV